MNRSGNTYTISFTDRDLFCGFWLLAAYSLFIRPKFASLVYRMAREMVYLVINSVWIYILFVAIKNTIELGQMGKLTT